MQTKLILTKSMIFKIVSLDMCLDVCINKNHVCNFLSLVFHQLKGKECKMTEEIRIQFVGDTLLGVEEMNGL